MLARFGRRTTPLILAALLLASCASRCSAATSQPPGKTVRPATVLPSAARRVVTVVNGPAGQPTPKLDTAGQQLDAHEGTIVYDSGLYWMIGNTYGCGYQWVHQASTWCGYRTYSSPDLVNWTNRGATFNPLATYWQSLCAGMGCFDARLIHDAAAGQWRMWFNAYNSRSGYVVMSAPSPAGPWRLMPTPNLAVGNNNPGRGNGAGGLFLDSNGVGYLVYTAWTSDGTDVIEKLDPHLVTGSGVHTHVVGAVSAEAPSLFRAADGTYAITYDSPGCAWCGGVGTSYATSPGALGPWTMRGSISPLSCNGQASAQVAVLPGVVLWMSDQWTNLMPGPRGPSAPGWTGMSDITAMQQWNQTLATQHWEPLNVGAGGSVAPITCAPTITVPIP